MAEKNPRLGPYELERRLGVGGMAETFAAIRKGVSGFEQRVCVKRTLPAFESDAEFVRLFIDEARVSATLRHANIVQVLDFGEAEGQHYLALELVEGCDLRELLSRLASRGEYLPAGLVSHLAHELGNALAYAHKARPGGAAVWHRDISPSNVLVSLEGEVKLGDFGIAKAVGTSHVTRSGVVKGKVPYMAPEYALRAEFDQRSDLFSLGVTLYEASCGKRPFDGLTDLDTVSRMSSGTHSPLASMAPGLPAPLAAAIERLIRPAQTDRFQNARELLDALTEAPPPPNARRLLGDLVERVVASTEPTPTDTPAPPLALAKTAELTPHGTEVRTAASVPAPRSEPVVVAGPEERTRTRATAGLVVTEGSTQTTIDLPGSAPTAPSQSPTPMLPTSDDLPTRVPPKGEHPAEIAAADTRPLVAASASEVASRVTEAVEPASGTQGRRVAFYASVLAAVVSTAGVVAWLAQGDPPPNGTALAPSPGGARSPASAEAHAAASPSPAGTQAPAAEASVSPSPTATERTPVIPRPSAGGVSPSPSPAAPSPSPASPSPSLPSSSPSPASPSPIRIASPSPSTSSAPATSTAPRNAVLKVIVIPFGRVWVDGRPVGQSPATIPVAPGVHRVATGDTVPSRSQTVRLRPGARVQVTIR